jgi:hypothetical protein
MTVEATSRLDLAALAQAVPSLLHVREGLRFTRGELVIDQLALAGGDQPSVAVRTRVSDLTALDDGREIRAEPFAVAIEAGLTEAEGSRCVRPSSRPDSAMSPRADHHMR